MTTNTVDALILLSSPEAARDPYPVLARLREEEPVHRTPAGFWLVSRHADAQALLAGDALRAPEQLPAAGGHASLAMRLDTMLLKDGAEHARLRRLVARDFTPRRVEGLRARMAAICDRLLDTVAAELHDGGESDLHRSLSVPFTLQVFSELLGVPEGDRAELAECVQDIVAAFGSGRPDQLAVADARTEHLTGYFRELAAARAAEPQDDLVSALVRARDDDPDRLAERELLATLWALWIVGFETTAAALDHGVLALLAHPELPLDDGFVAEVLRWSGPALFSSIPRIAVRDLELDGGTVPAGADVRIAFATANRDPRAFPDPDRFAPGRAGDAALALGHGIHYCLGAFLARAELAVALPRVRARFPALTTAGEPDWNPAVIMHAPATLPVRLGSDGA
ncbi:cytochrome P450 [Streptomyces sp. NBC_01613]|uniref:cytochrome P450 n=1 Tax=Streptomyces sp. NBC_01613 TaxID=2975896 RepID=UPI0038686E4B